MATDSDITQTPIEILATPIAPNVDVTQTPIEIEFTPPLPPVQITQTPIEVENHPPDSVDVTQIVIELMAHNPVPLDTLVDITQAPIEIMNRPAGALTCLMYALPIYLGPHNHVWKLGVAQPFSPVLFQSGVIIGTNTSIIIPTGFVDTSRGTTPGVTPLQTILTVPQHTNFYASKWRITALDPTSVTITRDPICNFESLVCRLNMQIPHSIVGNMPGEVI